MQPLHGRGTELALIRAFLAAAARGGDALLLTGEPGVGKTALVEAAARAATGATVLRARCVRSEADLTFSGLHEVLAPLAAQLAGLRPVHADALAVALGLRDGHPAGRRVLHDAVLALLARSAFAAPVVILVDDVEWMDRASADVLGQVARHAARPEPGARLGLLATRSCGTAGPLPRTGLREHEVRPLDAAAAAALLDARFPDLATAERHRVLAEARGNPLALTELPAVGADGATPGCSTSTSRGRLHALFAARVDDLPEAARRLLLLAALADTDDLDLLLGAVPAHRSGSALEAAEAAHLVLVDGTARRVAFAHPIVASTVVDLATSSERAQAHRALAALLAGRPARRAWHLAAASCGPDERVAAVLHRAAVESLRHGDPVGAVTTLLRAADVTPPGPGRRSRLAHAAHVGADVAGDLRAVPQLLGDAVVDPRAGGSPRAAVAAACLLLNGDGDIDTSHRLLVEAVETVDGPTETGVETDADDALVEALHTLLLVCAFGCRPELWPPFRRALDRLGPRAPATLSLCAWSLADAARTPTRAVEQVDAAVDGLRDEQDPLQIVRVAVAAFYLERLDGCRGALWRVVRNGRDGGAVASAINALMILAFDAYHTGRWAEADRAAAEGLALCDAHGYQLLAAPGRLCLALLAAARGDDEAARARTDELTAWGVPRGARRVVIYAHEARAVAALGRGDFEDAYQEAAAVSPPGVLEPDNGHALWLIMTLVEAAVRTHRTAEAAAHVAAVQEVGVAALAPRLALLVAGAAAMAACDGSADGLFAAALALPDVERWPFDLARVRLARGEHLRRARAATAAREHLALALDTFRSLGARPWAARAEGELRAATHHHVRRRRDTVHATLTAQEREVAGLAASGMTNQQVADRLHLSRRTVDAHLYRAFPKLGITSRAALRDALDRGPQVSS